MRATMEWFRQCLEHPLKIGLSALAVAFAGLLAEGTLIDLWNLKAEKAKIQTRYEKLERQNTELKAKILQAKNSDKFIGKQAREKLELVRDDELVFIFENDEH